MSEPLLAASGWLLRMAGGGGLLLLLTWLVVRCLRQPARQQRLAECGVAAALLLAVLCVLPSWLLIPLPARPADPPQQATTTSPAPSKTQPEAILPQPEAGEWLALVPAPAAAEPAQPAPPPAPSVKPKNISPTPAAPFRLTPEMVAAGLLGLYLAGALFFLGRLAWGYARLARFLRAARTAPARVRLLYRALVPSVRLPRLLASDRLSVPLSCGLLRPTVVLPASLCEPEAEERLRWVLAHELAHVRRRDAWGCLLFGLGQVVYYFVPWFWLLRRQARLCQEYVADAAAVAEAGAAEDYAEFLLGWSAALAKTAVPAGATGVFSSHSSDLFRRITMLVKNPLRVEERCPRRWSLLAVAGLLSAAVLAAGIGLQAIAAPVPDKKDKDVTKAQDQKKEDKKDEKKDNKKAPPALPGFPKVDDLLKQLPQGLDDAQRKQIEDQLKRMQKMMDQLQRQLPGGGVGGFVGGMPGGGVAGFGGGIGIGGGLPGGFGGLIGGGMPNFPQLPQLRGLGGLRGFGGLGQQHEPRLGARIEKPSAALVDQLDLPKGQGLVIDDVLNGSAAAKAGLKPNDILLELNGKPVPSDPNEFARLLQDVKPDTKVNAVVMRKTRKETIKGLSLPKAPAVQQQPGLNFQFPNLPLGGRGNGLGNLRRFGRGIGGMAGSTTLRRSNDSFTARNQQGEVSVTVSGKMAGRKAEASEIQVQDGDKTTKYDSLDKVPEQYRDTARKLLDAVQGRQGRRLQVN
jgi:beta-lactamase regulating signal transducer with metallopeptidase domain